MLTKQIFYANNKYTKSYKGGDQMARPRKVIDVEQFKKLCEIQCTLEEIAGFFDCSEDTIENWCKRELKQRFTDAYKTYSAAGKTSLRRYQYHLAEKNTAMAIWLGKQWLGQRESVEFEDKEGIARLDAILQGLKDASAKSETT